MHTLHVYQSYSMYNRQYLCTISFMREVYVVPVGYSSKCSGDDVSHVRAASPCHLSPTGAAEPPRHKPARHSRLYYDSRIAATMITSGFTNAPVSQFLVFGVVIGALVASLTDTRYYIHIQVVPHIWKYGQFWRFLTWQVRRFCSII